MNSLNYLKQRPILRKIDRIHVYYKFNWSKEIVFSNFYNKFGKI